MEGASLPKVRRPKRSGLGSSSCGSLCPWRLESRAGRQESLQVRAGEEDLAQVGLRPRLRLLLLLLRCLFLFSSLLLFFPFSAAFLLLRRRRRRGAAAGKARQRTNESEKHPDGKHKYIQNQNYGLPTKYRRLGFIDIFPKILHFNLSEQYLKYRPKRFCFLAYILLSRRPARWRGSKREAAWTSPFRPVSFAAFGKDAEPPTFPLSNGKWRRQRPSGGKRHGKALAATPRKPNDSRQ